MKEIKKVCVVGSGSMGRQIALNAAVSGFEVKVKTSKPEENRVWCEDFLTKGVAKGKYDEQYKSAALSCLQFVTTVEESVKDADLVIETILEDESAKRGILAQINGFAPEDAIICTNSSYMASSMFIDVIDSPYRLANLNYFNPAMLMTLVEIVRGPHTGDDTVEALKQFVTGIGKMYLLVNKEIEGFVVNRLLRAIQNEAFYLLENGVASFQDIDLGAEKGLNYPMGPFRLNDLTGLDITYFNRKAKYKKTGNPADAPPKELSERYEKGYFGKKAGRGWYDYSK